jgi:GNAT superfamily N-acetyltransferase
VEFTLTEEILKQIVYAMEDQRHRFAADRTTGALIRTDSEEGEGWTVSELVPLPNWQPIDGFQLMERFVARLHNPVFRDRLREALASGRGVFRKFKDILREEREIERLWFAFKERELRQVVLRWYNEQRELAGLRRLEEEPIEEEYEELLETDFAIGSLAEEHLDELWRLDQSAFEEAFPGADPRNLRRLYHRRRRRLPGPLEEGSLTRSATTPDGRFAGFYWAVERKDPLFECCDLHLVQLAVRRRFRGLGLGTLLLKNAAETARDHGYGRITARLDGASLCFREKLEAQGFSEVSARLSLDPTGFDG